MSGPTEGYHDDGPCGWEFCAPCNATARPDPNDFDSTSCHTCDMEERDKSDIDSVFAQVKDAAALGEDTTGPEGELDLHVRHALQIQERPFLCLEASGFYALEKGSQGQDLDDEIYRLQSELCKLKHFREISRKGLLVAAMEKDFDDMEAAIDADDDPEGEAGTYDEPRVYPWETMGDDLEIHPEEDDWEWYHAGTESCRSRRRATQKIEEGREKLAVYKEKLNAQGYKQEYTEEMRAVVRYPVHYTNSTALARVWRDHPTFTTHKHEKDLKWPVRRGRVHAPA